MCVQACVCHSWPGELTDQERTGRTQSSPSTGSGPRAQEARLMWQAPAEVPEPRYPAGFSVDPLKEGGRTIPLHLCSRPHFPQTPPDVSV